MFTIHESSDYKVFFICGKLHPFVFRLLVQKNMQRWVHQPRKLHGRAHIETKNSRADLLTYFQGNTSRLPPTFGCDSLRSRLAAYTCTAKGRSSIIPLAYEAVSRLNKY